MLMKLRARARNFLNSRIHLVEHGFVGAAAAVLMRTAFVGEDRNLVFRKRAAAVLAGWTSIPSYSNPYLADARVGLEFLKSQGGNREIT